MNYKTIKICTLIFLILFGFSAGMTACMQSPVNLGSFGESRLAYYAREADDALALAPSKQKALYQSIDKGSLWGPLRERFQLTASDEKQPAVQEQIRWFVSHPSYLKDVVSRATPYLYYVYNQVSQRHLPTELVLLPMIESGYDPSATNPASGAAGLWQLMSATARSYGVHEDKGFDGRRDLASSTNAALNYLTYLHGFFSGDWLLAIAAYDTGEGNVQNAIRRNTHQDKNTHFWALPLASETRTYIPRLLALAAIIKDPAKYGVTLPPLSDKSYLQLVETGRQGVSLKQAAKLSGMSLAQLRRLNPAIKNSTATLKQKQFALPVERVALYQKQLAAAQLQQPLPVVHTKKQLASQGHSSSTKIKSHKKVVIAKKTQSLTPSKKHLS